MFNYNIEITDFSIDDTEEDISIVFNLYTGDGTNGQEKSIVSQIFYTKNNIRYTAKFDLLKVLNPDILFKEQEFITEYKNMRNKCYNKRRYKKLFKEFESRLSTETKLLLEVYE